MTTKSVFLLKNDEDISKHTLLLDQDEERANKLLEEGKGVSVDLTTYETYRTQATDLYEEYKTAESELKQTDDPRMTADVKEWELGKLDDKLAEDTAELNADYEEYLNNTMEDAKKRTARAVTEITPKDEQDAKQIANRFNLQLAGVSSRNQSETVDNIVSQISLLTDETKTALQSDILTLVDNVGDKGDQRRIIEEVQDVGNMEAHALKIAESLPISVTTEIDIQRIIKGKDKE